MEVDINARNSVAKVSKAVDCFVSESYYLMNLKLVLIEQASPAFVDELIKLVNAAAVAREALYGKGSK